jgi:hypothetical protein
MNDHSRDRSSDAYTSPPRPVKKTVSSSRLPLGAGVAAAAAGLVWFFSPGFSASKAPAPVLPAPAAEPVLAMPKSAGPLKARAAAAPVRARRAEVESAPEMASVKEASFVQPAWVTAKASQGWTWPRRVGINDGEGVISRKLAGWFPANAAGKTLQYLLTADRVETLLYEDDIPAYEMRREAEAAARREVAAAHAQGRNQAAIVTQGPRGVNIDLEKIRENERAALKIKKGAATVRDVTVAGGPPLAELVYASGQKEVVPYDPLVFDLKGTGIKTTPKKVLFDLYGYGKAEKTQWMNDLDEGAGILVFNSNGSGHSGKSGAEVFGDRTDLTGVGQPTGLANGFEALRALVQKAVAENILPQEALDRGMLDSASLAALEKAYGLKMKVGGFNHKDISLAEAGIQAIALSQAPTQRVPDFDDQSNDLLVQPGAVFLRRDGTSGTYMNVWLKAKLGNLGLKTVNLR